MIEQIVVGGRCGDIAVIVIKCSFLQVSLADCEGCSIDGTNVGIAQNLLSQCRFEGKRTL